MKKNFKEIKPRTTETPSKANITVPKKRGRSDKRPIAGNELDGFRFVKK